MSSEHSPVDPAYKRGAEAIYVAMREASVETAKIAAGYAKWIVSTLLLLNAGAITGLLTFLASPASATLPDKASIVGALWWFVAGIIATLLCAFATWINLSLTAGAFNYYANPWMLSDPAKFRSGHAPGNTKLMAAYWAGIILGWVSVGFLVAGASAVSKGLGGWHFGELF